MVNKMSDTKKHSGDCFQKVFYSMMLAKSIQFIFSTDFLCTWKFLHVNYLIKT